MNDPIKFLQANLQLLAGVEHSSTSEGIQFKHYSAHLFAAAVITLTVATVWCKSVTVRTSAAERAGHIVTAEGTLVTNFLALVNVLANLVRSWCKAVVAVAFEAAFNVTASAVAANIGNSALVVI